jgi:hypothetical protein
MRTLLPTLAALLVASTALADPPKYTRKPTLALEVKLSDRVKPKAPIAIVDHPITGAEAMDIEERNQPIRAEQEAVLAKLVKQTPDTDLDKADLLFRLAEHYAKQSRFWRLKSME